VNLVGHSAIWRRAWRRSFSTRWSDLKAAENICSASDFSWREAYLSWRMKMFALHQEGFKTG